MHCLVLPFDLSKAVRRGPPAVRRGEDRFVREGACPAFSQRGKRLVEPAVVEKAEDEHGIRKLRTVISALGRRHFFDPGEDAQRLVIF